MREEAAKQSGIYIPKQSAMLSPSYLMTDPFFGPPMAPRALNGHLAGQPSDSSGMRDMVSMVQSMYMGEYIDVLEFQPRCRFVTLPLGGVQNIVISMSVCPFAHTQLFYGSMNFV